jgi:ABC-2 type transport system ATP-binding protein
MTALEAVGVVRRHRGGRGVLGVSLRLEPGGAVAVLGPNGAGKTTLMRILAGLDPPQEGSVRWFGRPRPPRGSARRRLGVVVDTSPHFEELSGERNAWFAARGQGLSPATAASRLEQLLTWAGLWQARSLAVAGYSAGMRRRLDLVIALVAQPELLLLDEPGVGLDPDGRASLVGALTAQRRRAAVVLATNDLELARACDEVLLLDRGRTVAQGRMGDLLGPLGPSRVELELDPPPPRGELERLPAVAWAVPAGVGWRLALRPGASPEHLVDRLGGRMLGFRIGPPDLSDLFWLRTGRDLAEDAR